MAIANVVVPGRFNGIQEFGKPLSGCRRGHSFFDEQFYDVVCFAVAQDGEAIAELIGGELLTPEARSGRAVTSR